MKHRTKIYMIIIVSFILSLSVFLVKNYQRVKMIDMKQKYEASKDLTYLGMCMDWYIETSRKAPDSIRIAVAEWNSDFPRKWKDTDEVVDPWGNPYKFILKDETLRLWSSGKNLTDEDGGGDDISITIPRSN